MHRVVACALGAMLAVAVVALPAWAAPPDPPTITSVNPGNAQITVAFDAPANDGGQTISGYTATCTDGVTPQTGTGTTPSIIVGGLVNGNVYTCTVDATNIDGTSAESTASGPVTPSTIPDAPPTPSVAAGSAQITVTFSAPADNGSPITGYTATCTDGITPQSNTGAGPSIVVGSLVNGHSYTCTVDAANANGTGPESSPSAPVTPVAVPDAPPTPSVVAGNTQITVTFSAPADNGSPITGYTATCTDGITPQSNTGAGPSIIVGSLVNGHAYTCTVAATNGIGTGPPSPASASVTPAAVPDAPPQPTVTRGGGAAQIAVTFGTPANNGSAITGYTATCISSDAGVTGSLTGPSSPITVLGLTNGKTYTCTVTATNGIGASAASPASAAIVVGVPDTLAQPTVAAGNNQIVVTFTAPNANGSPITSYTATCTSSTGGPTGSTPGPGTTLRIAVLGVTNGNTYTCTVTATNAAGTSALSPASATVVPVPVPDPPLQPTVTVGNAKITVNFLPPADNGTPINLYSAICLSTNGGAPGAHTGTVSPITVLSVTNGKTYVCAVTAHSAVGTGPPSPASIAVVPATVPAAPLMRSAHAGDASLTVTFTANSDNGRPITAFKVVCNSSSGGAPGLKSGPTSPIVVTGLTNGAVYTCKVRAANVIGTSGASAASNAVIVGSPGVPTIVAVVPEYTSLAKGALTVSFAAAPPNGSAVPTYRVTCRPVTSGALGVSVGTRSPISVFGLLTGKAYSCAVVATNARGTSLASSPVRSTVGAPAPPNVAHVLKIARGLVMPFAPPSGNGMPVINYRAKCTSPNGGVPSSPLQLTSPVVAANLTVGKTYTCVVMAANVRGQGPATTVGPVVVSGTQAAILASCQGGSGSMRATPGLQLITAQSHTFALDATIGACTGGYVQAAKASLSFRSTSADSCQNAIGVVNSGSGTITWTAPVGLGTSGASIQFVMTASKGHTTTATFHGTITSRSNVFSDAQITGTMTLQRGLSGTGFGGDCKASGRLDSFGVTSITMTVSS